MRKRNTYIINENMSAKYLASRFGQNMTEEMARKIIDIIGGQRRPKNYPGYDKWYNQFVGRPTKRMAKFWAIAQVAPDAFDDSSSLVLCEGGFTSPQKMDGSDIVFEYLNVGDTYAATIGYDHRIGEWAVTSWGDLVEKKYRRLLADRSQE